ncbi:unnamed protein product [Darwinula stevensoni]|uniref:Mediator of RNA polymerase II transcription subunit 8 n=1 Tax=Darwinula stevensoni TaxID=69355 RepID=A0A7R9AA01_9CRUS|nr:unnamed protein product [Darwinula stevensoni]CAG0897948.1 unnamed protein product [Darwinula stevensoni]
MQSNPDIAGLDKNACSTVEHHLSTLRVGVLEARLVVPLREEKALEFATDALTQRIQDLKNSIGQLLAKLEHEHETINWPSLLDSFALTSGQARLREGVSLAPGPRRGRHPRVIKNEKTPPLRNYVVLPLLLSPDRDEDLLKLTEGRIPIFSHEVVPDYLRTKPDPDVEKTHLQVEQKASQTNPETAQKHILQLNKICNNLLDSISSQWDGSETSRGGAGGGGMLSQSFNPADSQLLIGAVSFGRGIKPTPARPPGPPQPQQGPPVPQQPGTPMVSVMGGKAQSAAKANIKVAAGVHPYQR